MTATLDHHGSDGWLPPGGPSGEHPVAACVAALEAALGEVGDGCCWGLRDGEVVDLVARAHRVAAAVEAVQLRLVAEADRRNTATAAAATSTSTSTSTAAWLVATQRVSRREASGQVRLAADLDARYERVRAALSEGTVNAEQARVMVAALRHLPAATGAEERAAAETWLVQQAAWFGPDELRRLGRRVFEVIAPEAADAHEGRLLEAEEARATTKARLWMHPDGDGVTRGGFCLPDAQADMLATALDALLSPRRHLPANGPLIDPDLDEQRLPYDHRRGLAFCELIEHLPVDALPQSGRATPTLTVDVDLDTLVSGLGAATLSTGTRISAAEARRLACNAGLLPIELGGGSVPLDLGRESRFFSWHQRVALAKTQRGCVADGCDRPPA